MSRLSELLRQAHKADPQLGADLEAEISALTNRRTFGLVFEQHQPEAVELPGKPVQRGDKVRVLPPRGETKAGDQRRWRVTRVERTDGRHVGHLAEMDVEVPETKAVPADDLVVVAEFRDRIYPGLVETGRVERGGDRPFHTVINAENYHALEMLTYTHRHSVDAIYIDPPYNTGAKDWKYNNDYVEGDDDYRHSKWLAMMERRLKIARELLNPEDSALIVTIDEKEYLRLGLLLEQTFPGARIQMVTDVINPRAGVARPGAFTRSEEYIFYVLLGDSAEIIPSALSSSDITSRTKTPPIWFSLMRTGSGSARRDRPNLFYPVWIDSEGRVDSVGDSLSLDVNRASIEPSSPGLIALWPIRPNGDENRWQLGPSALRTALADGTARVNSSGTRHTMNYLRTAEKKRIAADEIEVLGKDERGALILKHREGVIRFTAPRSVWTTGAHDAGLYGSSMVSALLPRRNFPFPKSLYAVEDALRFFVAPKPNAVVLDFFAGSGTTAHALMRLNRQDGGHRQCISVTNNEVSAEELTRLRKRDLRPGDPDWEAFGICDYITKPRITAAITGTTPEGDPVKGDYKFTDEFPMAEGFEENAAFFTLTYEAPLSVRHNRAFERIAPILWMRAGSRGRIIEDLGEAGWNVSETYGVLENLDQADQFIVEVAKAEGVQTAFIVTDDESAFQMVCRELPSRVIPTRLYESYLQNFQINSGRSL